MCLSLTQYAKYPHDDEMWDMSGSWYQVLSQDALLPAEEAGKVPSKRRGSSRREFGQTETEAGDPGRVLVRGVIIPALVYQGPPEQGTLH